MLLKPLTTIYIIGWKFLKRGVAFRGEGREDKVSVISILEGVKMMEKMNKRELKRWWKFVRTSARHSNFIHAKRSLSLFNLILKV
jgi:hypothetical protein